MNGLTTACSCQSARLGSGQGCPCVGCAPAAAGAGRYMDILKLRPVALAAIVMAVAVCVAAEPQKDDSAASPQSGEQGEVHTPESESYYRQAKELYKAGPSKAPEIIALLEKAIAADKTNAMACYLLGLTYFGTERFDEALAQFDRALELKESNGKTINPELRFYRARTLFELGRCPEAKQILESHWAFWQDGGRLQERYEALYPEVRRICGGTDPDE